MQLFLYIRDVDQNNIAPDIPSSVLARGHYLVYQGQYCSDPHHVRKEIIAFLFLTDFIFGLVLS